MKNSDTITLTLNQYDIDRFYQTYHEGAEAKTPPYAQYQLKLENCTVTAYESQKVVFQGKDAKIYASAFQKNEDTILPQVGSDEVGTGDYFGPVVVCATYVDALTIERVNALHARDSKALQDQDILNMGKELMTLLPHSLLIVSPEKYNAVHENDNLNAIKAKLHNQAYINLQKKLPLPGFKIIDQFTPETSYYRYLQQTPTVIGGIHFETKAEDIYPSVACASIIARYAFLKEMEALNKKWDMEFAKGGGKQADESANMFVERYGFQQLHKVAKLHFKNTQKLKHSDD